MTKYKSLSITISIACYLSAIVAGYLAFNYIAPSLHFLLKLLIADLCATVFIYIISVLFNNSSMYDPYWSVKPMVFAFVYLFQLGVENAGIVQWSAFILMQLYGLRLTSNFYRDWSGLKQEDWRYVEFRNRFPKLYWLVSLSGIHMFPTVMVYLACLPLYSIFITHAYLDPNPVILTIGIIVLAGSVVLAFVADEQMRSFRKNPENKGKLMDRALWKYSRHPNYLGEVSTWWGLYLLALSLSFEMWYLGIGALAVNLLFVFISSPWLDRRSIKRRENFQTYMEKTRMLLPFPK